MNKEQFDKYPEGFYMWFLGDKEYYVTTLWQYYTKITEKKGVLTVKLEKDIAKTKATDKKALYFVPYLDKPFSNKVGTLLLDFLNADFSSFENSYNTFFYKYGFSFLSGQYLYVKSLSELNESFAYCMMYEWYSTYRQSFLKEWQKIYRKFMNYVYSFEEYSDSKSAKYDRMAKFEAYAIMDDVICRDSKNIEMKSDHYLERHYLTRDVNTVEKLTELIQKGEPKFLSNDVYSFKDLGKAVFLDFKMLVKNEDIVVKQCKNCGRYFQPVNSQAEVYCNLPNFDGSPTCKTKGARETYNRNLNEVEGLLIYRRTYQKRIMEVSRDRENKALKQAFDKWKKAAQEKIKMFKKGLIGEDALYKWMIENR